MSEHILFTTEIKRILRSCKTCKTIFIYIYS